MYANLVKKIIVVIVNHTEHIPHLFSHRAKN